MHQDGDWIYLAADGACETGDRPRLDRFNLQTREKSESLSIARGLPGAFVAFASAGREKILTRYESRRNRPTTSWSIGTRRNESFDGIKDPAPQLTGLKKELVKYARADGTQLSARSTAAGARRRHQVAVGDLGVSSWSIPTRRRPAGARLAELVHLLSAA